MSESYIVVGDCREALREMPAESVHCIVTSPPYFGLRDYDHDGQLGLEKTPEEYIYNMVEVFRESRRVLRDDGTLWLNIGDSYARTGGTDRKVSSTAKAGGTRNTISARGDRTQVAAEGLKEKDLIGIPWMLAFALRADGWYLRQDIIWHKPNPMPESVTDRCTKAHEYIFLLSKSPKYYYDNDAVAEPVAASSIARLSQDVENQQGSDRVPGKSNGPRKAVYRGSGNKERKPASARGVPVNTNGSTNGAVAGSVPWAGAATRNRRSVWTVTTKPFKGAHFATFPPDLIAPCILAGSPKQCCARCGETAVAEHITTHRVYTCFCDCGSRAGTVLDPFFGAGTTGLVAQRLGRNWIGCELNETYAQMAFDRISQDS